MWTNLMKTETLVGIWCNAVQLLLSHLLVFSFGDIFSHAAR